MPELSQDNVSVPPAPTSYSSYVSSLSAGGNTVAPVGAIPGAAPGTVSGYLYNITTPTGLSYQFAGMGPGDFGGGGTQAPATPSGTVSGAGTGANNPAAQENPLQQLLDAIGGAGVGGAGPAGLDTSQLGGTEYLPIGGSKPVSSLGILLLLIAAGLVAWYLYKRHKKKQGGEHHAAAA